LGRHSEARLPSGHPRSEAHSALEIDPLADRAFSTSVPAHDSGVDGSMLPNTKVAQSAGQFKQARIW